MSTNKDDKFESPAHPGAQSATGYACCRSSAKPGNAGESNRALPFHTTYDALGNRTSMDTDGVSLVNYSYDELSRLTGETTTFDSLSSSSFSIGYTYHLGGALKSITDPFSSTIDYTNDKTGRVTTVTGSAWSENTTGDYASNIKYRANGLLKQMDYDLPDETSQIKLEYDNRFRVSHSEVTSSNISGGYLMKADFSYLKDARISAKDDLLDDKFDRTAQYDFAGRLTFNQFGMGTGSDNSSKRVYEQTIAYDAFSQMTSRSGVHWGNSIGFSATYTNGRMPPATGQTLTYDAAGNIVYQQADSDNPHVYQQTIYDAAGRRTGFLDSTKGRMGGLMNMIREAKNEQAFDGDGRPVVEKEGFRSYNITNTNPAALTMNVKAYQIWSTVLGASLTSVSPTGTKVETSVYAGSAVIAKQMRYTQNSTNNDSIQWRTADPVTGTLGTFTYSGSGSSRTTEEIEPLGQTIDLVDTTPLETEEPIEIPSNQIVFGSAMDPEWQCQAGAAFYGNKFVNMPFHCQKKALLEAGSKLPWEDEREENPHGVSKPQTHATAKDKDERPRLKPKSSPEELARRKVLAATAKPDNEGASAGKALLDSKIPYFTAAENGTSSLLNFSEDLPVERDALLDSITFCTGYIFKKGAGWKATSITRVNHKQNGFISFSNGKESFTVESGVDFTNAQIEVMAGNGVPVKDAVGVTFKVGDKPIQTWFGVTIRTDPTTTNYVGNSYFNANVPDGYAPTTQLFGFGLRQQIHELGHSLSARFLGRSDYKKADKLTEKDYQAWEKSKREVGWQFEKCVYDRYNGVEQPQL